MLPARVMLSNEERENQTLSERTLLDCVNSVKRNGFVIIDNIFSREYIDALREVYEARLDSVKKNPNPDHYTFELDEKRQMYQLEMSGEFINPYLYKNYAIAAVCENLMPSDMVLSSFGSVTSYPEAPRGMVHTDGPRLFPENESISNMTPTYAVTATIPLVQLTKRVGGTTVYTGTHAVSGSSDETLTKYQINEYPMLGGCLIWDFRTFHGGDANLSRITRPLLYLVYCRKWYRDPSTLTLKAFNIKTETLKNIPKEDQPLFQLAWEFEK